MRTKTLTQQYPVCKTSDSSKFQGGLSGLGFAVLFVHFLVSAQALFSERGPSAIFNLASKAIADYTETGRGGTGTPSRLHLGSKDGRAVMVLRLLTGNVGLVVLAVAMLVSGLLACMHRSLARAYLHSTAASR